MAVAAEQPVRLLTRSCQDIFYSLSTPGHSSGENAEDLQIWARDQRLRLTIFADVLGVYAAGKLSVEYRLRMNPSARNIVSQLLQSIQQNGQLLQADSQNDTSTLQTFAESSTAVESASPEANAPLVAEDPGTAEGGSWSPVSSSGESSGDSFGGSAQPLSAVELRQHVQQRINDDVGNLISFAALIRSQSAMQISLRSDKYEPKDDEGNALLPSFLSFVRRALGRELTFGEPDDDNAWLRQRFEDTVVQRWRRICYCNHRARKLARHTPGLLEEEDLPAGNPMPPPANSEVGSNPPEQQASAGPVAASVPTVQTSGKATTLAPTFDASKRIPPSQAPTAPITVAGDDEIMVPKPKDIRQNSDVFEFICPLCQLPQRLKTTRRNFRRIWEQHALQDLAPYVCLYEKCPSPNHTYCSVEEWNKHSEDVHSHIYWSCQQCTKENAFASEKIFQEHLTKVHKVVLAPPELAFLTQASARKDFKLSECPLCGEKDEDPDQIQQQENLRKCMAKHMKAIALVSLPEDLDVADDSRASQATAGLSSASPDTGRPVGDDSNVFKELRQQAPPAGSFQLRVTAWCEVAEFSQALTIRPINESYPEYPEEKASVSEQESTDLAGVGAWIEPGVLENTPLTVEIPEKFTRTLHSWADGVSMDDGPLLRSDDPANHYIMSEINQGRCMALLDVRPGQEIELIYEDHKRENHDASKTAYRPSGGSGRRLGSPTTTLSSALYPITAVPPTDSSPTDASLPDLEGGTWSSQPPTRTHGPTLGTLSVDSDDWQEELDDAMAGEGAILAVPNSPNETTSRRLSNVVTSAATGYRGYQNRESWQVRGRPPVPFRDHSSPAAAGRTDVRYDIPSSVGRVRLLNVVTMLFEEFSSETTRLIPPYAIVSHQWVHRGEEVMYPHFKDGTMRERQGYEKFLGAVEQARKDEFRYLWMDTVCIDRSSATELTTLINSMWWLFKHSGICYVHLADVDKYEYVEDPKALEDCQWFARGWTLQELLAPQTVQFFTSDWLDIGSLTQLSEPISRSTGIPETALLGKRALPTFCVAERMSWAAFRMTQLVEDLAYCLVGLFDVQMDLRYGEGAQAFQRLQRKIIEKYPNDLSILAWEADNSSYLSPLLATSPSCFSLYTKSPLRPVDTTKAEMHLTNSGLALTVHCFTDREHSARNSRETVAILGLTQLFRHSDWDHYRVISLAPNAEGRPDDYRWVISSMNRRTIDMRVDAQREYSPRRIHIALDRYATISPERLLGFSRVDRPLDRTVPRDMPRDSVELRARESDHLGHVEDDQIISRDSRSGLVDSIATRPKTAGKDPKPPKRTFGKRMLDTIRNVVPQRQIAQQKPPVSGSSKSEQTDNPSQSPAARGRPSAKSLPASDQLALSTSDAVPSRSRAPPFVNYVESVSAFNLSASVLAGHLAGKFDAFDFDIDLRDNLYIFQVPRPLSNPERREIDQLRVAELGRHPLGQESDLDRRKSAEGKPSRFKQSLAEPAAQQSPTPALSTQLVDPDTDVLFVCASLFEFSLPEVRREAGYPYLFYVQGEIFDVVAQKGELWLARNQADESNTLGWLWEKHCVELKEEENE